MLSGLISLILQSKNRTPSGRNVYDQKALEMAQLKVEAEVKLVERVE
jgi:hypothetical protein